MSPSPRHMPIVPYLVIVALFFIGALWLHNDDVRQNDHNHEDCLIQTNHAVAINRVIDNIIEHVLHDPGYTSAERAARVKLYEDSKAIVPDCSH